MGTRQGLAGLPALRASFSRVSPAGRYRRKAKGAGRVTRNVSLEGKALGPSTPHHWRKQRMRARAEPGSGRDLGPQTGAEIESQAEVGVAGRV